MTEIQAEQLAAIYGGEATVDSDGHPCVRIEREGGHLVVFWDDRVCEYVNTAAFEKGHPLWTIGLR